MDEATVPNGLSLVFDPVGTDDGKAALTVVAGVTRTDLDFGYAGTSTIRGTVFHDIDRDNVIDDPFEPGIPFAEVTVTWAGLDGTFDTSDDVDFVVETDGFGDYIVECLSAGAYRITVLDTSVPEGLDVTAPDHPALRNVGIGSTASADFGVSGNNAPVAVDDFAETLQGEPVAIVVLGNDTDPEGDPITITLIESPSNGTAISGVGGVVVYTPDGSFSGVDTFVYTITDGAKGTRTPQW